MKLTQLRINNFQSFGPETTTLTFDAMCFLLGPNGAGKTAVLQALARLFSVDPSLRRIRRTDFHLTSQATVDGEITPAILWLEAQFEFPELKEHKEKHATIPVFFAHMQLESADGVPQIHIRLTAQIDKEGDIEEKLVYITQRDKSGEPQETKDVPKHDRNRIQVHYLPARRNPADHISYAANSLLGRALRAADWHQERESVAKLTQDVSSTLAGNDAVIGLEEQIAKAWSGLHKGAYYTNPTVSFVRSDIENLLRHLTIGFAPGAEETLVDFSRLSDGQQSLLYVSLVLSMQAIGREVLANTRKGFDVSKLRPAVFTLVAMEEPENSLSPHYLGRIIKTLTAYSTHHDAQAIIATHAPSLLRRVPPESIRYLRLDAQRRTIVKSVILPDATDDAHKFVREAVLAFPELYFSRLVILGEGDSEEIVLPRFLCAHGLAEDDASIVVAPLGGRHVNHFWRLLEGLDIPYVTLLDLDLGRNQGGWGRVKYVARQLLALGKPIENLSKATIDALPTWDNPDQVLTSDDGKQWRTWLEDMEVFYSAPLDLDFAMLLHYPAAYGVKKEELNTPDTPMLTSVLGKEHAHVVQYNDEQQKHFAAYHRRFKLGSKPSQHLQALAAMDDKELVENTPPSIARLIEAVRKKLEGLPE
jgi:putative ATP-dependent endonuclease of OLD family